MIIDRKTLSWIKDSIDEHLDGVMHAPDEFANNVEDTSPIQTCIEPLRRIKGAVQIVGVSGATLLAEELIQLAQSIVNKQVKDKREAATTLATGMLQLPGYLESLYHGQPDIPLILLPLLNDIRAVQDKELLTEGEFFSPDLSVNAPLQAVSECIVSGDITTVAKKLRPGYLSGLLGVIRESEVTENIEKLILVVDNLLIASTDEKSRQFWWIALGVIESLYEQGLDLSVAVKMLLGRVDQQIQKLIVTGEQTFTNNPPDKIIKNLLYYIAQSQTYNTRIVELKKAYHLDYPEDTVIKRARESLYGFNSNLIESITEQVKEELTTIKTALEICTHARAGSTQGLSDTLKHFNTVADALGMLGMNAQKDYVINQRNFLDAMIVQGKALSDDDVMGIAAALLHIESALMDLGSSLQTLYNEDTLSPADYEQSLKLVSKEIIKEINFIKDNIQAFSKNPHDQTALSEVPDKLSGLVGAMHVLKHDSQASITQSIREYVTHKLMKSSANITLDHLDKLADAIMGVENFYQTILEESVAPELGLRVAAQSLTELGYTPHEIASNPNYGNNAVYQQQRHILTAANLH